IRSLIVPANCLMPALCRRCKTARKNKARWIGLAKLGVMCHNVQTRGDTMLQSQRHQIILSRVSAQPAVTIRELTQSLGVSRETVRKDIEHLAGENRLLQVRGGATRILTAEPPSQTRAATNRE